jgi:hypothetical protein
VLDAQRTSDAQHAVGAAASLVDVRNEWGQQKSTDLAVARHVELVLVVGGVGEL